MNACRHRLGVFVLCFSVIAIVHGIDVVIENTKHTAHAQLTEAGREASLYGSQACYNLLAVLSQTYGKHHIRKETLLVSQMGQFLAKLDCVLIDGVISLSRTVNTTLDQLNQLVDHFLHPELFDTTATPLTRQVDDVIEDGRRAVDEDGVILFQSILHIMGEYFKGYAADDDSAEGRSARHGKDMPEVSSGMRQVATDTYSIVDKETREILEDLNAIGTTLKKGLVEAEAVRERVQPYLDKINITSVLQNIIKRHFSRQILSPFAGKSKTYWWLRFINGN